MTPDQYGLEPSWMPLILVFVMAIAATLLFLSLRRHVRRIDPDPASPASPPSPDQSSTT